MLGSLIALKALAAYKSFGIYMYFAAACDARPNFFSFPTWYKYLPKRNPEVGIVNDQKICSPHISNINDFWLVGLAVVEILLRIGVIAAIIFVMLGGMKYVNSRGNADKTESAKKTIVDALIGLVIAVAATAVVSFIGTRFSL
jgi:type IV secretion system pilin